jgi:hypothetical protein
MAKKKFKITAYKNDDLDGFAAYKAGSIKDEGGGIAILNIEANLVAGIENDIPLKEMLVETLMHEVGHALEEWYDLEFSEDRIEKIIESYRNKDTNEHSK